VQSVCLRALQGAEGIRARDEVSFRGWLHKAALRVIYTRSRYHQADKRARGVAAPKVESGSGDSVDPGDPPAGAPTASEVLGAREDLERVESAFERLPEADRELILLARLGDLTHAELARHLGCGEAAARQRLSRALARLWASSQPEGPAAAAGGAP